MVTRVIGFRRRESESLCRAGRRWSVVAPRDPSESMAGRRRATLPARGRRQRGRVASGPRWAAAWARGRFRVRKDEGESARKCAGSVRKQSFGGIGGARVF